MDNAIISFMNKTSVNSDILKSAVDRIRSSYSATRTSNSTIDYDNFVYQCAYVYQYLPSHENIVRNVLNMFWGHEIVRSTFRKFVDSGSVYVCSIGGGPGSDIFGLNSVLAQRFGKVNISGVILDLHTSWKYIFDALIYELQYANLKNVSYQEFDILTHYHSYVDWETKKKIFSADIVTIVKFVSAVSSNGNWNEISLLNLLRWVKTGAIVLFVDNSGGGFSAIMSRAATSANLQKIDEITHETFETPLNMRYRGIDLHPQTSAAVSASLWMKRNTFP